MVAAGERYLDLAATVESPRSAKDGLFACPSCEKFEFAEAGGWEICSISGWEDDPVQEAHPEMKGWRKPAIADTGSRELSNEVDVRCMNMAELRVQVDDDLLTRLENAARTSGVSLDNQVNDALLGMFPKQLLPRESLAEVARRIAAMTPPGVTQMDSVKILRSFRDGAAIEE